VKIKYVENIKKPLAIKIINQPSDSEIAICVSLKNFDDASRLKKQLKLLSLEIVLKEEISIYLAYSLI
jgi:hypothetical protein